VIPQIGPWIDDSELAMLREVCASTYLTEHNLTSRFEAEIRALTGAKHAIAMSNGTVALYCAFRAMGVEQGDEVLVPDLTFIATSNAVMMAGGRPVFVDVDHETFCMDPDAAARAITPRTRGVCPVHLYGVSAQLDALTELCRDHDIWMVEDAAQAIGVRWKGRHVGTFGRAGILSFYGNKTITTGEGGVVLTDDDELARTCYRLKNHGRDAKGLFVHEHVGFNFSFTEMQAAVGIAQLAKLPRIIARKAEIRRDYETGFRSIRQIALPVVPQDVSPVFWFTSIIVPEAAPLASFLAERDIQTRRFFLPLHLQPCYQAKGLDLATRPSSLWAYEHGLSLPSSYQLTDDQQGEVIGAIRDYFGAATG
jgi:perosamine synthetase